MDFLFYGFVTFAFFAVAGVIEGVLLIWNAYNGPEAVRIRKRLRAVSESGKSGDALLLKKRQLSKTPWLHALLQEVPGIRHVDRLLVQSGKRMMLSTFAGISALLALLIAVVALALGLSIWVSILATLIVALLPMVWLMLLHEQRLRTIEQQLPEALDLMARALRAGHAFSSAMQMVGAELSDPLAHEFRMAFDEINFGASVQNALTNLAARVDSTDLRYFVVAVLIQREAGGNLAELMTSMAGLIRDRLKLMGSIRVLSAEGRLSAWILGLLPFSIGALINVVNPHFMDLLWSDPIGIRMVTGVLVMMAAGVFWMWRIIAIRV